MAAIDPAILAAIQQSMGQNLGSNPLYGELSQIAPANTRNAGTIPNPYDPILAQLQANPLFGVDPTEYYRSIGGENVRAYNQPDDIRAILGDQTDLMGDIGQAQADQLEWSLAQQDRDRENREYQMQFGDPGTDLNYFIDMAIRAAAAEGQTLTPLDVINSLQPSDPDYLANVNELFTALKPMDPFDDTGTPVTPDSQYGRTYLAQLQQAMPGIAQDVMAQEAAGQAESMENQAFRKAYIGATGDKGWENTSDNQWFSGEGAGKRAEAWENRKVLSPEELKAQREANAGARKTARSEYEARQDEREAMNQTPTAQIPRAEAGMPSFGMGEDAFVATFPASMNEDEYNRWQDTGMQPWEGPGAPIEQTPGGPRPLGIRPNDAAPIISPDVPANDTPRQAYRFKPTTYQDIASIPEHGVPGLPSTGQPFVSTAGLLAGYAGLTPQPSGPPRVVYTDAMANQERPRVIVRPNVPANEPPRTQYKFKPRRQDERASGPVGSSSWMNYG